MKVLAKVLSFSLLMIFAFTAVTWVLPQRRGEVPSESPVVDAASMSLPEFVALGKTLYEQKGNCTLCHNSLGRAPDLVKLDTVKEAEKLLSSGDYSGSAKNAEDYLRESMTDPSAYVVKGFGKLGSNDTESPMPAVDQPPIELSMLEIDAIIAYLQDKDQHKVSVVLPSQTIEKIPESSGKQSADSETVATAEAAQSPEQVLAKYGCGNCHRVGEANADIGPDLRDLGQRQTLAQIRDSIIAPAAVIAEGYAPIMPDYSERMSVRELELLSQYLWQEKNNTSTAAKLSVSAADGESPPL